MTIELTVLGCAGSFASPAAGPCSGYLVRVGGTAIWMDCGNGTFEQLQRHTVAEELSAVVITHRHPDHCVDLLGYEVLLRYYRGVDHGPLVLAPADVADRLASLSAGIGGFFAWDEVGDGDERAVGEARMRFSRTDHSAPTVAVEVSTADKRLVYSSDTGPGWSPAVFGDRPDLLLTEATYQRDGEGPPIHLTAAQAGAFGASVDARRLVITHLSPLLDPSISVRDAEASFGGPVTLAAPGLRARI